MKFPADLKYHPEHTWAKIEGDTALIGITDHAQKELGEVLYVDLPEVGAKLVQGEVFGSVESAKVASDLFAPMSGQVLEFNEDLEDNPELVNESPYEEGWIAKIKLTAADEEENLMDSADYENSLA